MSAGSHPVIFETQGTVKLNHTHQSDLLINPVARTTRASTFLVPSIYARKSPDLSTSACAIADSVKTFGNAGDSWETKGKPQ